MVRRSEPASGWAANIAVSDGAFDGISIRQRDASGNILFVQSGDRIEIEGQVGQSVLANVRTEHRFRYIVEGVTDLEDDKVVLQRVDFGADTTICPL